MRLEYYPSEKLKKEVLEILGTHLNMRLYRVFFFGSRVTRKGNDRSDIDIGIEGPPISSALWMRLEEKLEKLPTLYKIEFVDFSRVSRKFRDVALVQIEELSPVA